MGAISWPYLVFFTSWPSNEVTEVSIGLSKYCMNLKRYSGFKNLLSVLSFFKIITDDIRSHIPNIGALGRP